MEVIEFGGPEVLTIKESPDPRPGPGQLLIDVAVAGVQSLDGYLRRGAWPDFLPGPPPYAPGLEAAGVVAAVGDGVDPAWLGRRVVASLTGGGYASRVVAGVDDVLPVRDDLDLEQAMALLHDGSTAAALLEETPVEAGETVLVLPAAGGLGSVLVQLAVIAGARVIGAARGSAKLSVIKELGADQAVDYGEPGWPDQAGPVDVVFDGVSGDLGRAAFGTVRAGGRYANYGNASGAESFVTPDEASGRGIRLRGMEQLESFLAERSRRFADVQRLAAAGTIRPIIGRTYPLDQVAEAHRAIEAREISGKVLLIPGRPGEPGGAPGR
ncbi:zinc-binding dehydrogenase [Microlunatus parietis]